MCTLFFPSQPQLTLHGWVKPCGPRHKYVKCARPWESRGDGSGRPTHRHGCKYYASLVQHPAPDDLMGPFDTRMSAEAALQLAKGTT